MVLGHAETGAATTRLSEIQTPEKGVIRLSFVGRIPFPGLPGVKVVSAIEWSQIGCGGEFGLYVSRAGNVNRLRNMSQLRGLAQISRPDQAMDFVRVRTCPGNEWPVDNRALEVQTLLPEPSPPDPLAWHLPEIAEGTLGYLRPQTMARCLIKDATCRAVADHFEIDRFVVIDSTPLRRIEEWYETVSSDGDYRCEVLSSRPWNVPSIVWKFQREIS